MRNLRITIVPESLRAAGRKKESDVLIALEVLTTRCGDAPMPDPEGLQERGYGVARADPGMNRASGYTSRSDVFRYANALRAEWIGDS